MLIIDRIEGEFAVVEYGEGKIFNIPMFLFPEEAKEGDVIQIDIILDKAQTAERKKNIKKLLEDLFE